MPHPRSWKRLRRQIRQHACTGWWTLRRALHRPERSARGEKLSVILLSYRRPANLRHLVASLLVCDFVDEIVLSNNNPAIRMEDHVRLRDPRLRIINQPERRFPSLRYDLARTLSGRYFLAIDDDLFLSPRQIRILFESLQAVPAVPHGAGGELIDRSGGELAPAGNYTAGHGEETDILLWAYAFTRLHLDNYFDLLARLGLDNASLRASEDVLISFCGARRPRSEALGRLRTCPSANDDAIATWRQDGFHAHRLQLFLQCRAAARSADLQRRCFSS